MRTHFLCLCAVTSIFAGLMNGTSADAQVPLDELKWLAELYELTDGEQWIDNSGWSDAVRGSECSWFGVTCEPGSGMRSVVALELAGNRLRGALPTIGTLPLAQDIDLSDNALNGSIPASLLTMESLNRINLSSNRLAGPLPAVPSLALSTLNLDYNALFATGPQQAAIFSALQPGWQLTQTTAPSGVRVTDPDARAVTVRWTPITYQDDGGGYVVLLSNSPNGPFREVQSTQTKQRSEVRVSGLTPNTRFYFAVAAVTRSHPNNRNVLRSQASASVSLPVEGYFLFSPRRASARESQDEAILRVSRFGQTGNVSVNVTTLPGTATADVDYLPASATLTWADGESGPKDFAVTLLDDDEQERSEFFRVRLSGAAGDALLPSGATTTVVIQDDDFPRRPRRQISAGGRKPAIAFDSDGRRLVAWEDQDDDGSGISAILLSESGEPIAPPFRVNKTTAGDQLGPDVAFSADGGFAIAWRNEGGPAARGANGGNLVGSFFAPTAEAVTEETSIDDTATSAATDPSISSSNDGEVTVTWQDENGDVQTTSVSEGEEAAEPQEVANDVKPGTEPQTASTSVGRTIVIWETEGAAKGQAASLVGAVFNPASEEPEAEFIVSTDTTASAAAIAASDNGEFVVTWQEQGQDGSWDIRAQIYDASAVESGSTFTVNSTTPGDQTAPRIGANSAGDFAIVWQSLSAAKGAEGAALVGAFFDPQGDTKSSEETIVEGEIDEIPQAADVSIDDDDEVTVVYELQDDTGATTGVFSEGFSSVITPGVCLEDDLNLCLNSGRFQVSSSWRAGDGSVGQGTAVALSDDTGYFWFFDEQNVELTLKVLDGCAINGNYWVFAGGLTDVEVNVTITDTETGRTRSYINSSGNSFAPIQDTQAFDDCTGSESHAPLTTSARTDAVSLPAAESLLASCDDSTTDALCLNQERFAVTVTWATEQGTTGVGRPVTLTGDTGTFWFFDEQNVEVVIKVLDGCAINGSYWVFAAGLTNVEAEVVVTDTQTLAEVRYSNPLSQPFQPIQDTGAFASCP